MKNNTDGTKRTEKPGGKKRKRVVRIFNLSEDVWPFIESMGSVEAKEKEIEENANLADRDLFSEAEEFEFTFITAKKLKPSFVKYFKKLCMVRELEILVPHKHSGLLCEDIMTDKKIMSRLKRLGRKYRKLELQPYSTTANFLRLVRLLREDGVCVTTPISPDAGDTWTVNFYGSKSGIRQVTQINRALRMDLKMPDGLVCSGTIDTARIAANKYIKEGGVVIKTNKGHAGMGVQIFRKGDLPDTFAECEEKILEMFSKDSYWERFPIIVESLVKPDSKIGGGFPNAEFFVKKNGEVNLLYFCGMRVNSQGVFGGVEISDASLPKRVASRITDIGYLIGEQYSRDGYVGYFDIDYISGRKGEIFVNESNVRVTGGTHVFQAAKELVGRNFVKNSYVLSDNMYQIPGRKRYRFGEIIKLMKPILFSRKTKEGVVIASANLLSQRKLAYIVFGKNKKRAEKIENEMKSVLGEW